MKKNNSNPLYPLKLRQRAEAQLKKHGLIPSSTISAADLHRLVLELAVHQIELEMQNEELQHAYDEIKTEHERYNNLFDFAPVGYLTLARDSKILKANLTIGKMLSCGRSHLEEHHFSSFIDHRYRSRFNRMLDKVFQSKTLEQCEIMIRKITNSQQPTANSSPYQIFRLDAIISDNPQECRITLTDVSDTRQATEALKQKESHYRWLFEAAQEGILILDYKSGKIVDANPFIAHLMGFSLDEIVGKELVEIGFILDKELARKAYEELQTKNYIRYSDLPLKHKSGKIIEVEFLSYVYNVGDEKEIQCNIRDITLQKQLWENEKKHNLISEQLAMHDPLTGLPNRRLLSERISLAFAQARRNKTMVALMMFDLDKFKPVNDTLGHAIGDILLQQVAARSKAVLRRGGDSISRLGGDEFVILLAQIVALSNAVTMAEKIRQKIKEPYTIEGHAIDISCSIGIAVFPDHGEDELTLMKHADDAMYSAKNNGRDNVRVYKPQANLNDRH